MSQRLAEATKWICLVLLSYGSWSPVEGVTVRAPPSVPATIEAQAKFFQDFFSVQLSPYNIEFGHVCEDPNTWEQRYEKKDFKNHRDMGKVRWGDKKGGYGEHYWDLNHAGHTDDHGINDYDDGSYHEDPTDNHNEFNEQPHSYETSEYNPDETSLYEENGRAKRAYTKVKPLSRQDDRVPLEQKQQKTLKRKGQNRDENQKVIGRYIQEDDNEEDEEDDEEEEDDDEIQPNQEIIEDRRRQRKEKFYEDDSTNNDDATSDKIKIKPKRRTQIQNTEEAPQSREKNHIVLIVNQKQKKEQEETTQRPESKRFVPYENSAGMRQHVQPKVTATPAPRLFLDAKTGHIVDRATGQAYILQPIPHNIHYN